VPEVIPRKKLQVFVSSTYADLKEERQAAVEAILSAGHIPAGMELFAAGDKSQMEVIKRWIDESDVFLLILGGRYGSIEPTEGKSYIQLEYEYAQERKKPFFAVVIDEDYLRKERVKERGADVLETDNAKQLKAFRAEVLTKIVRLWRSPLEIKLAIHETVADFGRREELIGWIPGNQAVNSGAVAEEIARLAKENASLREQLSKVATPSVLFNGLTYEQLFGYLSEEKIDPTLISNSETLGVLKKIAAAFGGLEPALLHVCWLFKNALRISSADSMTFVVSAQCRKYLHTLADFGLIQVAGGISEGPDRELRHCGLTGEGRNFLRRLMLHPGSKEAPGVDVRSRLDL
jgi:hypothetical protein